MYHQLPPPVDSILDWHIAMAFLVDARLRTRKNTLTILSKEQLQHFTLPFRDKTPGCRMFYRVIFLLLYKLYVYMLG